MTGPVFCDRCGARLQSSHDQIERRIEYRSVASLRRLRTWRVALVCRLCAAAEWSLHDHPHGRDGEQGSLL